MATDTATEGRSDTAPGARETLLRLSHNPYAQWGAFLIVHVVLWLCGLYGAGMPLGDVTIVYLPWAQDAQLGHQFMGVTAPWVYPLVAMVPILIPLLAGPDNYVMAWLAMVTVFDVIAFAVLVTRRRNRATAAAWWWLAFLLLLGPVVLGRLDAVSVAIVIVALVWLAARPRAAAILLAVATWIKVWPAGIILAILIASRRRWRMLGYVLAASAAIVILGVAFGGLSNLFSFVTQQTGRGLQIEAPISAPWFWAAALHAPGSFIYYDQNLLTFQVMGRGIDVASAAMTLALAIAVIVVVLIGLRAVMRKAPTSLVLPQLSLAIVTSLIAFNKVGSPQYIAWLAAPVVLGLLMSGRRFLTPAILVGVTAGLTQLFYPWLYLELLNLNAWVLAIVTVRNVMLFVVLGWSVVALWRTGSGRAARGGVSRAETSDSRVWPLNRADAAPGDDLPIEAPAARVSPSADELFPQQL
ncbi:DUF2029 domain-containing protein [Planctomonas sp. JC2975]|uniref:glycosyltransferase 87 family protein n=1 Tax=Planctomonas sp. JC2975 TaxID=2729626 RepID=UPI001474025D|nr:glycosyltransferase 87 family protein [Planctomonas sp. JC2975]NNC13139.1 DUF2029 domain-containing protein [Planctomonas sp. JC2975]